MTDALKAYELEGVKYVKVTSTVPRVTKRTYSLPELEEQKAYIEMLIAEIKKE